MTRTYKILGQSMSGTTPTALYTAPSASQSVVSTLTVCNQSSTGTYSIAVVPNGQTINSSHYIVYQAPLTANDSINFTIGITMSGGDKIMVASSTGSFSFSAFGSEVV